MKNGKLSISIIVGIALLVLSLALIKPIINNINYGLDLKGGFEVLYKVESLKEGEEVTSGDLTSTYKSIRNRIDTLGVSEPEIIIEGDKIRVKLPGTSNEDEARKRLSTPAVLTFRDTSDNELMNAQVLKTPGASLDYDKTTGKPVVALAIKDNDTFYKVTKKISESADKTIVIWLDFEEGDTFSPSTCTSSDKCISYATVNEGFANNVVITGNFTEEEANELIDLINSGSLPTKLIEVSTKSVDASFGENALNTIALAGIITIVAIALIMIYFYRLSGVFSSICLLFYIVSVFLIFNSIDGVLTLPSIAALILGIGMAVDSSIITFEKIKEELSNSKILTKAYMDGNKRSLISLVDANITTFLAALVLFIFGESSVKGFATMLMLTIIVTMVTMVLINRVIMNNLVYSRKFEKKETLLFGKVKKEKSREFLKISKYNIAMVLILIVSGIIMLFAKGINLGIDFNGGSSIEIKSSESIDMDKAVEILNGYDVIEKNKVSETEGYIKIKDTLSEEEINNVKSSFSSIEYKTNISVISNIVKKDLTNNAIKSLIIASIVILIYIAVRFTFNFAISSIVAIISDVLVTISLFIIFNIEINFIFVAAILTIIGYSINDTIVVFDMIRDKINSLKDKNEKSLKEVINDSIKLSLKRNMLTSITTLSAVIVLLVMNISSIREFNIAVLFGLFAGTFSSLFIAPYILYKLELRSLKHPKKDDDEDELEEKLIKGINI